MNNTNLTKTSKKNEANSGAPGEKVVPAPHVTPVVVLLLKLDNDRIVIMSNEHVRGHL